MNEPFVPSDDGFNETLRLNDQLANQAYLIGLSAVGVANAAPVFSHTLYWGRLDKLVREVEDLEVQLSLLSKHVVKFKELLEEAE